METPALSGCCFSLLIVSDSSWAEINSFINVYLVSHDKWIQMCYQREVQKSETENGKKMDKQY